MIECETEKTDKVNVTIYLNAEKGESYTLLEEILDNWGMFNDNDINLRIVFRFFYAQDLGIKGEKLKGCILDQYCILTDGKLNLIFLSLIFLILTPSNSLPNFLSINLSSSLKTPPNSMTSLFREKW